MSDSVLEILVKVKDEAGKALDKLQTTVKGLGDELDAPAGDLLETVSRDSKKAETSLKGIVREVKTARTNLVALGKENLTNLRTGTKKAKDRFKELRKETTKTKKEMGQLGSVAGSFLAAFSVGAVINETVQFSRAITEVSTLVDSAIVPTDALADSVLDLSSAYGTGAVATANALYQGISAGAEAGAEANNLLEVSLKSAKAGVTDAKTSIDGITTVVNAFGYEMGEAESVADIMFATVKAGKTDMTQLSSYISQAAPLAASLGVSFEEVSAGIVGMTLQGSKTSSAMTSLRAALQGMLKPAGDAEKAFKANGFESAKAAIKTLGLQGAMDLLAESTKGEEAALIKMLGSIEGVQAFMQLTGKNAKFMSKGLDATTNSAGAMQQAFDKVEESLAQQFDKAVNTSRNSLIKFGKTLQPTLIAIFTTLQEVTGALSEFVTEHREGVTTVVTIIGSLTAAYVGFKALKLITHFTGVTQASRVLLELLHGKGAKSATSITLLGSALQKIPPAIKAITLAIAANPLLALASAAAIAGLSVYNAYLDMKKGEEAVAQAEKQYQQTLQDTQRSLQERVDILEVYGNVNIRNSNQIKELSRKDAESYKGVLDKVIELAEVTVALGNHQRATGETVVAGYAEATARITAAKEALELLDVQIVNAGATSTRFSDSLLKAVTEGKDGAEALAKEFESFDAANLVDVTHAVKSLSAASTEAFTSITGSATLVDEALRASLQEKPATYIQTFLNSLKTLQEQSGATTEEITRANQSAVQALFGKLSISVAEDLVKVDEELNTAFSAMVQHGDIQTDKLVEVVQSNINKLKTDSGIEAFRTTLITAFEKVSGDSGTLDAALKLLSDRQLELADRSNLVAQALTSSANALGITTIEDATRAYNDLTTSFELVQGGFDRGAVSSAQYNDALISYLQETRDYLIEVKGVSEEVANAAVNSSAIQQGLQIAVSKTGDITQITQEAIREQYDQTRNKIIDDTSTIEGLQRDSMEAIKVINTEGWGAVGETVKNTFDEAVLYESQARTAMLASQQAYLEATELGNQEAIVIASQQYEEDLTAYKEAVQEKNTIAQESANKIVETTKKATEEVKKLGQEASYAVFNPFQQLAGLNETYVKKLQDSSAVVQQSVFPTLAAYYRAMNEATQQVANAREEHDRATITYHRLTDALEATDIPSKQLIQNAEYSIRSLRTLDQASLDALQSSIDAAKRKLKELFEASQQTLQGLRSELAQLRGETEKVEGIRYQQRVAELQASLEQARQAQDQATINNLEESLRVLEDIHRTKLKNIRDEKKAQLDANREVTASGGRGFATGGYVSGQGTGTSDSILSWLSNGEYVIDAATVRHFGIGFMRSIQNAAKGMGKLQLPSFKDGGAVSSRVASPTFPTLGAIADTAVKRYELSFNVGGQKYTGAFAGSDADGLIQALKDSGAVT